MLKTNSTVNIKDIWEEHWIEKKGGKSLIFETVVSFYRKFLIATQVSIYINRYFSREGIFLELGSGTSESSYRISKQNRLLGAVDFSTNALSRAKSTSIMDFCIKADFFKLPFKDACVDGIWNVGVMEHFNEDDLLQTLKEFNRVLKREQNCCCVLFWPWIMAPSHIIFNTYEQTLGLMGIYKQVFPRAVSMFKNRKTVDGMLKRAGFSRVKFHFPFFDLTHFVVVGHKL